MKGPLEEARRWLLQAQDEYQDAEDLRQRGLAELRKTARLDQYYVPTRYPNGLPGGVPSRFYTDPEEAAQASELAGAVLKAVAERLDQRFEEEER